MEYIINRLCTCVNVFKNRIDKYLVKRRVTLWTGRATVKSSIPPPPNIYPDTGRPVRQQLNIAPPIDTYPDTDAGKRVQSSTPPPPIATYPDAGDSALLALISEHLSADVDVRDQFVGSLHYHHLDEASLVEVGVETSAPLRVDRLLLLHVLDAIWW